MMPFATPGMLEWLLASSDPAARWIALVRLQDRPASDPEVQRTHEAVLADAGTRDLVGRLGDWEKPSPVGGHDSPAFIPNLLGLLADMGVAAGDDPTVDRTIDAMTRHAVDDRMATPALFPRISSEPILSSLLCDSHAIVEVLIRFGQAEHPLVKRSLERMAADLEATAQGQGWTCLPSNGFRGPGRKGDVCPMVTLEALRAIGRLPADQRPLDSDRLLAAARTLLGVWTNRGSIKPYMFGHGVAFKTVKWPGFWYSIMSVLEALGAYPELWRDETADSGSRRAIVELVACFLAYNLDPDGRVTPRSCNRGFEAFSFGQKKAPSPFATARLLAVLRPFEDLAADVAAVDVSKLGSSKGGKGTAVAPR